MNVEAAPVVMVRRERQPEGSDTASVVSLADVQGCADRERSTGS